MKKKEISRFIILVIIIFNIFLLFSGGITFLQAVSFLLLPMAVILLIDE